MSSDEFQHQTAETLCDAAYWRRICPELHCCDVDYQQSIQQQSPCKRKQISKARQGLSTDGFASIKTASLSWSASISKLAAAVLRLHKLGHPPTAIAAYDETWVIGRDAATIMSGTTGNSPVMDVLSVS